MHESKSSQRLEKKFIMARGQSLNAKRALYRAGFSKGFDKRKVNSVYFDDLNLSAFRDNIDGNPYRDKLRVRWYNEDYNDASIEIKHKRNMLGYKTSIGLSGCYTENELISCASNWVRENVKNFLMPVSKVIYLREYLLRGEIRATADTEVCSGRIFGTQLVAAKLNNYEVIELKYDQSIDNFVRKLYSEIEPLAMRATKCSKYANSLLDRSALAF